MRRHIPNDAVGLAAVILALAVFFAIVALAVGAAIAEASEKLNFSEPAATVLSTVLGAAVGAVAAYVGTATRTPEAKDASEYDWQDGPDPPT